MKHFLEVPRGHRSPVPALVKQVVRFSRRLREHGIYHAIYPALIEDGRSCCKVTIGSRSINVFNDGSCTRSLLRSDASGDGRAFIAQSNRMHAIYLAVAAEARKSGFLACARSDITLATQERQHHERTSSI